MKRFEGKHVLITGATGGIGRAMVHAFAQEGARVCLSGRNHEALEALHHEVGGAVLPLDLGDPRACEPTIKDLEKREGPIDILVNNGGIIRDGLAMRLSDTSWESVIQVNLTSAFQLARAVLPGMLKKKWGRIISISSIIGFTGNPGQCNYAAAKAGLTGLTKSLALEVARKGITVNAVAPGYIETAMTQELPKEELLRHIPCQSMGQPEDVAYCVLFLADERANYITGQTLHCNGGLALF